MKHTLFTFFISLLSLFSFSQDSSGIALEPFNPKTLHRVILNELNRFRQSKGLDTLEYSKMLSGASAHSAKKMAKTESEKIDPTSTLTHLKKVGATVRGQELTMKAVISKGREDFKNGDIAKVVYNRWENNPKDLPVLTNPKFTLIGITVETDKERKKVYISAVLGGYDITNEGLTHKKEMAVPYNTKSKSLKAPDAKTCKTCESWRNYDLLQKGLDVREGKIILTYPNTKELRRILKKEKDGLAVDVVQRSQYTQPEYNIVDNNLLNKGVMTKVMYKEKFFKKNLLITKNKKLNRKVKGIEVEMGKFNPEITGPFELNLIVVQNGKVCKAVTRGYTEKVNIESKTPIGLLAFENTKDLKPIFEPRSESSILNFTIPFEKNKFEFKAEDIQPFIKALNEPDFIIEGVYIYAFSSIEGDSVANAKLQSKRGESVVSVLQGFQSNKIIPSIQTKDSWDLFLLENEDGPYADIVALGKKKAIAKINDDKKLMDELEPILAKERFAQIIMDVTYDVSGEKEQRFSTMSFNKGVKGKKITQAHKILNHIGKRVEEGQYPASVFDSLMVDLDSSTVSLINNRMYYRYLSNPEIEEEDGQVMQQLLKMQPGNPVLQYNALFCNLKLDSNAGSPEHQAEVQQRVDALYGKIDSNNVNGLNIEWQFKVMEAVDTLANADVLIDACIARIKAFYNIKEASWQNNLKLALVFSRAKDYKYAANLLEPYLNQPDVNENLVFLYISLAGRSQEKYYSRTFARALEKARELNQSRYCQLFGKPYMTFQVLENPEVKRVYQGTCRE